VYSDCRSYRVVTNCWQSTDATGTVAPAAAAAAAEEEEEEEEVASCCHRQHLYSQAYNSLPAVSIETGSVTVATSRYFLSRYQNCVGHSASHPFVVDK